MKNILLAIMASLVLLVGGKDLRVLVLTPSPVMHCESCEIKIKDNMRFEKGVKKIETSLEQQTVTITYDASKTDIKKLQAAMQKIGRQTTVVSDEPLQSDKSKGKSARK